MCYKNTHNIINKCDFRNDLWKWVSKAASKFIVYDLPARARVALVTFSNDSAVAQSMTTLTDERSRVQMADRIPNKYKVRHLRRGMKYLALQLSICHQWTVFFR